MQLMSMLRGEGFGVEFKRVLFFGLFFMGFVLVLYAKEPANDVNHVPKELQKLELKLEKAIQKIDNQENEMVQKHLKICKNIEKQFKDAEDKKRGSKISKKQRKELSKKLAMEYRTIDMIKQLNMLSRDARKKEYESNVEKVFAKHDVYLSNQ